ncbi:MAG: prephenate dehydrogenase/arogenate dehydrogenase family protein [Fidelibacterota bacterium]|nr:MAG: prephenate dehydrogenase/arogenate dehydrogenase family protein [Candidatus Neomarinimicrobiota bacterium]
MEIQTEQSSVGIIGFGRFGPVLAKLLLPSHNVLVYDLVDISDRAMKLGVTPVDWDDVVKANTLFLAVPIRKFKEVVAKLVPRISPVTTVFDVCSVKVYPTTVMKEYFPPEVTTIASHPLFGPDSTQKGFKDLPMVMYPVSPRSERFNYWLNYFHSQGLRVLEMTPEEHDQLAARSQGITHFIGRVLAEFGIAPTPIDTEGCRDLQLVVEQTCHDSFELFHDLENYNPYTMEMVDAVLNAVEQVKLSILRRD